MSDTSGIHRLFRLPHRTPRRIAADVDDELAFHLEQRAQEYIANGMSPDAARCAALARFGDLEGTRAALRVTDGAHEREIRWREWLAGWGQDVRFAMRQLRRAPAFAAVAIATLALGIGATTAIFSAVYRLLLADLPVPNADRIVTVVQSATESSMMVMASTELGEAWRDRSRTIENLVMYETGDASVGSADDLELLRIGRIERQLPAALGAPLARGRSFVAEEMVAGGPPVAIVGYGMWQTRFGGRPDILEQSVRIDGVPHAIVGVMGRDFDVPFFGRGDGVQLWVPLRPERDAIGVTVVAWLRPGVSVAAAERELTAIHASLRDAGSTTAFEGFTAGVNRKEDFTSETLRKTLLVLLGATGVVLLIACANVANLLLARAATRARELAVRAAVGAGRRRLMRQLLTESLVLAAIGGVIGLVIAQWSIRLIVALRPDSLDQLGEVRLEPVIVAAALGLALLTGILFGVAPALFATARAIAGALKTGAQTVFGHGAQRRFRSAIVVAEVALSVVLLVGAGLLARSVSAMQATEVGFRTEHLLALSIELPEARYPRQGADSAAIRIAYDRMLEAVRALPGVQAATVSSGVPPRGSGIAHGALEIEGRTLGSSEQATLFGLAMVRPDYFPLLQLPVVRGRVFSDDPSGNDEWLVNETMARRYWPDGSALGQRIRIGPKGEFRRIVGIVADVEIPGRSGGPSDLMIYRAHDTRWPHATLIVRTSGEQPQLEQAIPRAILALEPGIRVRDVRAIDAELDRVLAGPRFSMALLGAFALIAGALAAVGLYGVIAFTVSQRLRELGVRMALGARPGDLRRLVVGQGLRLTTAGVVLGLAGAVAGTRFMQTMLHGVSPLDPVTFSAVGVLLGVVAVLATLAPARRAARVDPAIAMRAD